MKQIHSEVSITVISALFLSLLLVNPVHAQVVTPTAPSTNAVIDRTIAFAQSLGILGFIVALLGIGFILLIIVVILFIWRVAAPLLNAWAADRSAREAAALEARTARTEQQSTSNSQLTISNARELKIQELNTRQAEATEQLGGHLKTLVATMNEKDEHQAQRHVESQKIINVHTDEVTAKEREAINKHMEELIEPLRQDVNLLTEKVDKGVTLDQIKKALEPLQDHLNNISQNAGDFLRHTGKTGNLDPQVVIDAERKQNGNQT